MNSGAGGPWLPSVASWSGFSCCAVCSPSRQAEAASLTRKVQGEGPAVGGRDPRWQPRAPVSGSQG